MRDFTFYAPTEIVFGRGAETQAGKLLKKYGATRVLIHYGSGSAVRSGLLGRLIRVIEEEGLHHVELGGVHANPRLSKVYEGIDLARREKIDFILAVGGGSVIDSAKSIAYGVKMEGDVWDLFAGKAEATDACPFGCVLTIAASGSEMGGGCVLTKEEGGLKWDYVSPYGFSRFSILNPELTEMLPPYQTACGCTDILMHTLERFFHSGSTLRLTDRIAVALMRTVMEAAGTLQQDPHCYEARAEVMWAGSLSHNGLTGCGGGMGSWVPHKLQCELGGRYDIAHGAGLAAIWPSWARFVSETEPERFAVLGETLLGLEPSEERKKLAEDAICTMEEFFRFIGMPTRIPELGVDLSEAEIRELSRQVTKEDTVRLGDLRPVGQNEAEEIFRRACGA